MRKLDEQVVDCAEAYIPILEAKLAVATLLIEKLEDMLKRISWNADCREQSGCCEKDAYCPECSWDHASALVADWKAKQ